MEREHITFEDWLDRVTMILWLFVEETTETLSEHPWRTWYDQFQPPAIAADLALDGYLTEFVLALEETAKQLV